MDEPSATLSPKENVLWVISVIAYIILGIFLAYFYFNQSAQSAKFPYCAIEQQELPDGIFPKFNITVIPVGHNPPSNVDLNRTMGNISWKIANQAGASLGLNATWTIVHRRPTLHQWNQQGVAFSSFQFPFAFKFNQTREYQRVWGLVDDEYLDKDTPSQNTGSGHCLTASGSHWTSCRRYINGNTASLGTMRVNTGLETADADAPDVPGYDASLLVLPYALTEHDMVSFLDAFLGDSEYLGTRFGINGVDPFELLAAAFPEGVWIRNLPKSAVSQNGQSGTAYRLTFSAVQSENVTYGILGKTEDTGMKILLRSTLVHGTSGVFVSADHRLTVKSCSSQITMVNALTSWFTILHTLLAMLLMCFPTNPRVPRYFMFGKWPAIYKRRLVFREDDALQLNTRTF